MQMMRSLAIFSACLCLILISCEPEIELPASDFETSFETDYSYLNSNQDKLPRYLTYEPIKFLNKSTNAVTYSWDFGNGKFSSEKEPVVRYEAPGNYNVKLTATSETGHVSHSIQEVKILNRIIDKITMNIQAWNFNLYNLGELGWTNDKVTSIEVQVGVLGMADDHLMPSTILYNSGPAFKDFRVGSAILSVGGLNIPVEYNWISSQNQYRPMLVVQLFAVDGDKKQLFYSSEYTPGLNYYLDKNTGTYKMESGTTIDFRFAFR